MLPERDGLPGRENSLDKRVAVTLEALEQDPLLIVQVPVGHGRDTEAAFFKWAASGGLKRPTCVGLSPKPKGAGAAAWYRVAQRMHVPGKAKHVGDTRSGVDV